MTDLERDLRAASGRVVHDPPDDVTARVESAVLAAVHDGVGASAPAPVTESPPTNAPRRHRRVRIVLAATAVAAALAGAVVIAGLARSHATRTPSVPPARQPTPAVRFVPADPAAAAQVPIVGANALERTWTLAVLAGFGAGPGISRVRFDMSGPPVARHTPISGRLRNAHCCLD